MFNLIDILPAIVAAIATFLICIIVYKAVTGNQTAVIILTAIISFGVLVGAAAAGTAEVATKYQLEICIVNVSAEEISIMRISDGNEYVIDFEEGWVNGLHVVIFNNNNTTSPYDDIVIVRNELVNDFIHNNI